MRNLPLLTLLIGCCLDSIGQVKVKLIIDNVPATHREDAVFVTGQFQRWQPAEAKWQLRKSENGVYEIEVPKAAKGLFEYKFTRGTWKSLESTAEGRLVAPRKAYLVNDTVIHCSIPAWRDDFPASTASPRVAVLDTAFFIPQLNKSRRVWIYLPRDYSGSKKKYPVLYMHDGQDLFDEATSEGRIGPLEWSVDETLDAAANPCIVIAVEHAEDKKVRIQEYYYHNNPDNPNVQGKQYLEFLVKTLKPYIDKKFRTLPDRQHTYMAGSSMGGLITFYAGLMYPQVFGALGVLSPSIWLDYGNINRQLESLAPGRQRKSQRYFFYAGGNENRIKPDSSVVRMHDDVAITTALLKKRFQPDMEVSINPEGRHGAWYWRQVFPTFYNWLTQPQQPTK